MINGIILGKTEFRILQYADDSILTLSDSASLTISLEIIKHFTLVSGLKLNIEKCQGLWLGPLKRRTEELNGISFKEGPQRVLGIYVGTNEFMCNSCNWDMKLEKFRELLIKWDQRKINLYDKVMVLKLLAMPIITLNLSVLVVPKNILNQIQKSIFNFIWGKTHKVNSKTIIGHPDVGGLGVPNVF